MEMHYRVPLILPNPIQIFLFAFFMLKADKKFTSIKYSPIKRNKLTNYRLYVTVVIAIEFIYDKVSNIPLDLISHHYFQALKPSQNCLNDTMQKSVSTGTFGTL